MRTCFLFILLIFSLRVSAQGKLVVIYADASANTTNYALSNKLYDAIQETESRLILYISNESKPLICTSIYDMSNLVDKLSKLKPVEPNCTFDLDSINRLLNHENSMDGIGLRENNVSDDLLFFFFFNAERCRNNNQLEKIADALLLSNRLVNKEGLLPSCKVRIYLSDSDSELDKKYIRKIKEEKGYDVVTY